MKAHLLRLKGFALRYWIAGYSSAIVGIAIAVLIMTAIIVFWIRNPSEPDRRVFGVVQTVGVLSTSRLGGGNRQVASVRLADETIILADARYIAPLSAGDGVTLLVHSRQKLQFKSYEVIAKNPR